MVKANDQPLVVINQVEPVYVSFSVHQQHLTQIRRLMSKSKLAVAVSLPAEPGRLIEGTLAFINNTVNTATGTIQLQAVFPNKDHHLWPGQYVWAALTLSKQKGAVLVPSQALQTGQMGTYVFVIKPDHSVEIRAVEVDRVLEGETIVKTGLRPGDQVVTDGQFRLVEGSKVDIKKGLTDGKGRQK
jgi:multidrug efflux system membrane fusion protein